MSFPDVELPHLLSFPFPIMDDRAEIFIKLPSCNKTVKVPLDMKISDFLGVISSISGIPVDDMLPAKRFFRVVWAGMDLTENVNVTLSSFGIQKESTIHVGGILRGCVIWEHHARERDRNSLETCMLDIDIEVVIKALDEYGVNRTYITSERGLKELLMNYAWANFTY